MAWALVDFPENVRDVFLYAAGESQQTLESALRSAQRVAETVKKKDWLGIDEVLITIRERRLFNVSLSQDAGGEAFMEDIESDFETAWDEMLRIT